jgi:hypothetical protein
MERDSCIYSGFLSAVKRSCKASDRKEDKGQRCVSSGFDSK